jgi:hypothetical protein
MANVTGIRYVRVDENDNELGEAEHIAVHRR